MTQEEKARAYDEALKKARFYHGNCPSEPERKKLEGMFPVLRVSEDEEMLQTIIRGFENWKSNGKETFNFTNVDDILAYLEKQKENIEKEYVFRPLAGTDINTAILQAIRRANEGEHLVLAFNGAYIPVRKGCNANKIVDIYDAFIEKQKEQKPIPANSVGLKEEWSEEQMVALDTVLEHEAERVGSSKELEKANVLYEQLKKLTQKG